MLGQNRHDASWVTGRQSTYNSYDNANLYNDYVVSTLIKDYKATDPNGFLLYFSDHGEGFIHAAAQNSGA
ncbi:sulfatase-like hydrolase/transferase [Escherichia coli]